MRAFAVFLLLCPALGWAQAAVRGVVHDPNHRPIPGATVSLSNLAAAAGTAPRQATTNANGEFAFAAVAAGDYRIAARVRGFRPAMRTIAVSATAAGPVLHLLLHPAAAAQEVTVRAKAEQLNTQTSTTQTAVSQAQITRTPGADQANSVAMITDYVPGATVVHDMLHVRGGHQESWFVDGIPVLNTNIASNVGPSIAPGNIEHLQVETGGYSAQYGDRTYGFFNAITPTGFSDNNRAEVVASYGSFHQTNDQISLASHTDRLAYYTSLNGNFSHLGLNPPEPRALHDNATGLGGMASLLVNASPRDQVRVIASLRGDTYQIPNTAAQQAAGVADLDRERDGLVGMSWTHVTAGGVVTVSPFYHDNRADYIGGPNDTPFVLNDNRRSRYYGVTAGATLPLGEANTLNTGVFVWRQQDDTRFALAANPVTPGAPASAAAAETPAATAEDPYIEDTYKPLAWLTLDAGLRYSHYSGLISEHATDPRLSAAIELPVVHWTLHGYAARYYQEPPLDTVSGPILAFALQQGYGFTPLHGERDTQWDAGVAIPFRGWALNLDHFRTDATNFLDHDEIGNSDIFLPLADAAARITGDETSLTSPVLQWGGRLTLTWSNQIARASGPVSGGLVEFAPAGFFYLDHDQRNTFHAVYSTSLPGRAWASGVYSFGSGFLNGDGPAHLPPHSTAGLALGRAFGERLSLSLNATNLLNSRFLIDNSNTFGGTHWEDPRQVYVELRYRVHY